MIQASISYARTPSVRHTTKIVLFLGFGMDPKVEISGVFFLGGDDGNNQKSAFF